MVSASLKTSSSAEKIISLLSAGKEVRFILTLNCVSSCMSQSDASKGDASAMSRIALVVALLGVEEPCDEVVVARPRRALLAPRVGMNGVGVLSRRSVPPPRPRLCPRPRGAPIASLLLGVVVISSSMMLSACEIEGMIVVLSDCGHVGKDCDIVGQRWFTLMRSDCVIEDVGDLGRGSTSA